LLMSDCARVNPKPELEIYADDVTASHGCTVGSLNKTELFYLKSRGLSEADARAFLQYAFAEKIVEEIEDPEIRDLVETQLLGELTHGELIAELKESVDV
ncbi:SufD family Fe-S cluster assembly protein, partial [Litoricolaceae bacterium]|nr:SufD family Fe-S cluster assembly protein [Litorivicinaceae bacterium]